MTEAVIVSAVRTPVGKAPSGTLRTTRPDEMGAAVLREALPPEALVVVDGSRALAEGLPVEPILSLEEAGSSTGDSPGPPPAEQRQTSIPIDDRGGGGR